MAGGKGFLTRMARAAFAGAREYRSSLENPQVPLSYPAEWLLDIFNGGRTDSGIRVSEMTALQVGTVYSCVNIISNGFASLPLHVYERVHKGGRIGKRVAHSHDLYDLLHNEPNVEMTTFTWLKTLMVHGLLWGNGYAEIERDKFSNSVRGLWIRNPARTRAIRTLRPLLLEGDTLPPGTLLYETSDSLMGGSDLSSGTENPENRTGRRRLILAEDMIHVPGLSLDGRVGQSTVWLARQIIGLALATEKYGAKFFGNGARPAGVLEIPQALEDKAIDNLRRSWAEAHGGENAFKVAVLESGVKFQKIAATPEEGQMLGTRQYQRAEICAIFNVPMHMVAASEKGGKSNVEQNSIEFVLYCLKPWLTAWSQELERKLFPKIGRSANKFFPHFDTRQLMYPDSEGRAKFYQAGRQWGFLSSNDVRELEDMNPIEDGTGDLYMVQVNMQPADMPMTGGPGMEDHLTMQADLAPTPPAPAAAPAVQPAQPPNPGKPSQATGKGKKPAKKKGKRSLGGEQIDQPLFIMRHGTTDANEQDVYRGWGDYKLDEQGRADAAEAAQFLKGKGIKRIVTSTLLRHTETANIVAEALGNVGIEHDDNLRTLNVGVYTGKKRADYADELQWYLDHPEETIPGGESLENFGDRNAAAMAKHRTANESSGPILIVTSRSNIAALENEGVTGADIKVAEPGGVYRMDGTNNLELIYGDAIPDSLAGT